MITNQILQNTIEGITNITRAGLSVYDTDGKLLAGNIPDAEEYARQVRDFIDSPAETQEMSGYQFFKVNEIGRASCRERV